MVGRIPAHHAVISGHVEVLEFMLGEYPEAAAVVDILSLNLLHFAARCLPEEHRAAKVRLLCARYPQMMIQRDGLGNTPLLVACYRDSGATLRLLCEAGGQEAASAAVVHPTRANHISNGQLPLHWLIEYNDDTPTSAPLSELADTFRLLLRLYPEAAGTEGGVGVAYKKTPSQLAVDKDLPPYYRRLLLRAAPHVDPAELRRLNWAERRTAMFVAFAAVAAEAPVLARLRAESKDLVKQVVSYL